MSTRSSCCRPTGGRPGPPGTAPAPAPGPRAKPSLRESGVECLPRRTLPPRASAPAPLCWRPRSQSPRRPAWPCPHVPCTDLSAAGGVHGRRAEERGSPHVGVESRGPAGRGSRCGGPATAPSLCPSRVVGRGPAPAPAPLGQCRGPTMPLEHPSPGVAATRGGWWWLRSRTIRLDWSRKTDVNLPAWPQDTSWASLSGFGPSAGQGSSLPVCHGKSGQRPELRASEGAMVSPG